MVRIRGVVATKRRKKRILKDAKGQFGKRSKNYTQAKRSVVKGLTYEFRDRKVKKREFRKLWIARINAAVRANSINYSQFIFGLKKANIDVDRKILSELAINNPENFSELVNIAKEQINLNTEASASC